MHKYVVFNSVFNNNLRGQTSHCQISSQILQNTGKHCKPLVNGGIPLPPATGSHKPTKASSTGIEDKSWVQSPETTRPTQWVSEHSPLIQGPFTWHQQPPKKVSSCSSFSLFKGMFQSFFLDIWSNLLLIPRKSLA